MPPDSDLNTSDYYFEDAMGSSDSEDDMDPDEEPIEVETDVRAMAVSLRPQTPVIAPVEPETPPTATEAHPTIDGTPQSFAGYPTEEVTEELQASEPKSNDETQKSPVEAPTPQPGFFSRMASWVFGSSSTPPPKPSDTSATEDVSMLDSPPLTPSLSSKTHPSTTSSTSASSTSHAPSSSTATSSTPRNNGANTAPFISAPPARAPNTDAEGRNIIYNYYIIGNDPAMLQSVMGGHAAAGGAALGVSAFHPSMPSFGIGSGPPPPPPPSGGPPPPPPPPPQPSSSSTPIPTGPSAGNNTAEKNAAKLANTRAEFIKNLSELVKAATKTRPENQEAAIKHWIEEFDQNRMRAELIVNSYGRLLSNIPTRYDIIDQIVDYWETNLYNYSATAHKLDDLAISKLRASTIARIVVTELEWREKKVDPEDVTARRLEELERQRVNVKKSAEAKEIQANSKGLMEALKAALDNRKGKEDEEEPQYDDDDDV